MLFQDYVSFKDIPLESSIKSWASVVAVPSDGKKIRLLVSFPASLSSVIDPIHIVEKEILETVCTLWGTLTADDEVAGDLVLEDSTDDEWACNIQPNTIVQGSSKRAI